MITRRPKHLPIAAVLALAAACAACQAPSATPPDAATTAAAAASASPLVGVGNTVVATKGLAGWTDATHGKDADPTYDKAFPQGKVGELRIVIEPADWKTMIADMTKLYGERTAQGGLGGPGGMMGAGRAPRQQRPPGGGPGGGPGGAGRTERPMWVPATITYDGKAWTKVGVRFKGNSSLMTAWRSGTDRLPFKLDFDQFEDEFPDLKDQRFFGFKQLSLSTNMGDAAAMRDAIAYEVLAEAGHAASKTTHYEVLLDHGPGAVSLGLYTAIEVTDDTVVDRHFGSSKGNIYEADGPAMSLAEGVRANIPASFPKENNEDSTWADVEALYDALHAPTRTTDAAAWRAGLEKVFDVEIFLEWLAIAAALQHWDTYGGMSHNAYLYHDPKSGRLQWISWDHNLILGSGGPGGGGPGGAPGGMAAPPDGMPPPPDMGVGGPGFVIPSGAELPPGGMRGPGGMGRNSSLGKQEVRASWPLIRFLLDDPTYFAKYVAYMDAAIKGPLEPAKMKARVDRYAAFLGPFAKKQPEGAAAYEASVTSLRTAIDDRAKAVAEFLANPTATPSPAP